MSARTVFDRRVFDSRASTLTLFNWPLLGVIASTMVAACAPSGTEPARSPDETSRGEDGSTAADHTKTAASPGTAAANGEPSTTLQGPPRASNTPPQVDAMDNGNAENADFTPRELVYRVRPDGLLIDYDGLELRPRARAQRLANGGYGITLTVAVKPSDETNEEVLLSDGTPLSVYARIYDKAGRQKGAVPDVMGAPEIQEVCADCPARQWEATWPPANTSPLWWGERVVLEVGLWGLGQDDADRRPLERLFLVEYKAGDRAEPIINPPQF